MVIARRIFAGHPRRIGSAALAFAIGAALAWYLGSPLFIKTYANEALPSAGGAAASASTTVTSRTLASGQLRYVDSIHNGKGPVAIIEVAGQRILRFADVAITNAPDIHVYLSRETGGKWSEDTSLYLGALKATNGSFNYDIPAGTDLAPFKSVVIWCRNFRTLITWSDLQVN